MPVRTLIAIAALALVAAPAAAAEDPHAPKCERPRTQPVALGQTQPKPHQLDREPNANGYLALDHRIGRCSRPLVIARGLGANPAPERPQPR